MKPTAEDLNLPSHFQTHLPSPPSALGLMITVLSTFGSKGVLAGLGDHTHQYADHKKKVVFSILKWII